MTTDAELLREACELLMIATFYTPAHQQQRTDVCNRLMDAMTPKPTLPACNHYWSDPTKTASMKAFCFKCGTLKPEVKP